MSILEIVRNHSYLMNKEKLLKRPLEDFNLVPKVLRAVQKTNPDIHTLEDLLGKANESSRKGNLYGELRFPFQSIRELGLQTFFSLRYTLISYGFRYEDGEFFQWGTKRYHVERLMRKHSLTKAEARKQFRIARSEGQIETFFN